MTQKSNQRDDKNTIHITFSSINKQPTFDKNLLKLYFPVTTVIQRECITN